MEHQQPQEMSTRDPRIGEEREIIPEKQISERKGPIANPKGCIRKDYKKMFRFRENSICKEWEYSLNFQEFEWEPGKALSYKNKCFS